MYSQLKPSETPRTLRSEPMETATRRAPLGAAAGLCGERGREGAEECEGLEVDAEEAEPREPAGLHVGGDQVAVGDDEEDALRGRAVGGGALAENLEVEDRLVDRDRQRLLRAEADSVRKLLLILDACDLDRADADAVVGEPDADVPLRQLLLREELLQRLGERLDVAHLTPGDQAGRQRRAGELHDLGGAVHGHARGVEPRGAELETDDLLRHVLPLAPGHPQARRGVVRSHEAVALEEAPELVGPARALERDVRGDLPVAGELEHGLAQGLHAPAGIRLHDRVDLLDLRLADEVPDRVVGSRISSAATRPWPSTVGSRVWETMPCSEAAIWRGSAPAGPPGKTSIITVDGGGRVRVCRVAKTRWPVSAAVSASPIVSRSRNSPIRITSGSWRSARRSASSKQSRRCRSRAG